MPAMKASAQERAWPRAFASHARPVGQLLRAEHMGDISPGLTLRPSGLLLPAFPCTGRALIITIRTFPVLRGKFPPIQALGRVRE